MSIKIELHEEDFAEVASPEEVERLKGKARVLGREDRDRSPTEIIEDLLPSALVERVRRIVPDDFELTEITMDAEVSGRVLGAGLSGSFSMTLSKKKA